MSILLLLVVIPLFNTITSSINNATVTNITTMPKDMKVKFSRNFEGEGERNHNTPSVCSLSKVCNSNVIETTWCVKLKLTGFVVRDVEQTNEKKLHPNATASTHSTTIFTFMTTTATKA